MKPEEMVVVLVTVSLLLLVVAIGSTITFDQPSLSTTDLFTPFADDEEMWINIIESYPDYPVMNDVQKTTVLRMWAADHMYRSGYENIFNHELFLQMPPHEIFNHFAVVHDHGAGVMCYGFALALQELYEFAGFKNYLYSYGYDGCCHAMNLVWVTHPNTGEPALIYQDAYFDTMTTWPNGTVITYQEMVREIRAERFDNIVMVHRAEKPFVNVVSIPDRAPREGYREDMIMDLDEDTTLFHIWGMDEYYYYTGPDWVNGKIQAFGTVDVNDWVLFQYPRIPVHPDIWKILEEV